MRHKDGEELRAAQAGMPIPVENCPGIYHCGFHSEKSFGATSYIVQTAAHGNIMVDCPRFNPKLAKNIEALGGVNLIVLSHMCALACSYVMKLSVTAAFIKMSTSMEVKLRERKIVSQSVSLRRH
jgi:hypothetical protein